MADVGNVWAGLGQVGPNQPKADQTWPMFAESWLSWAEVRPNVGQNWTAKGKSLPEMVEFGQNSGSRSNGLRSVWHGVFSVAWPILCIMKSRGSGRQKARHERPQLDGPSFDGPRDDPLLAAKTRTRWDKTLSVHLAQFSDSPHVTLQRRPMLIQTRPKSNMLDMQPRSSMASALRRAHGFTYEGALQHCTAIDPRMGTSVGQP